MPNWTKNTQTQADATSSGGGGAGVDDEKAQAAALANESAVQQHKVTAKPINRGQLTVENGNEKQESP